MVRGRTTVLVVADRAARAAQAADDLRLVGHEVVVADAAQRALELVAASPPDLVLLDVVSPAAAGWAVLRGLREHEATGAVPVVVVTAPGDERARIRAHIHGVVACLTAPVDSDRLHVVVEAALRPPTAVVRAERRQRTVRAVRRLAELEAGRTAEHPVRLSALERTPTPDEPARPVPTVDQREGLAALTVKQRWLAAALGAGWPARRIAEHLEVSRSNVYATRRRVARRLGVEPGEVAATADALGIADEVGPPPAR